MREFAITIYLYLTITFYVVSQPIPDDRQIVNAIAQNIVPNSAFTLKNSKTSEIYSSSKGLKQNPDIIFTSGYNDWRYWNGVVNIAMGKSGASRGNGNAFKL